MPITPIVVVVANRAQTLAFQTLSDFAQSCHDMMVAAAITFPAPPVDMPTFQTDIDNLQTTIDAWGVLGARGSHADYVALLAAREQVLNDLISNAGYVQTIARVSAPGDIATQESIVLSAGMRVKSPANSLALWGAVNNFRQLVKQSLQGSGLIQLKWSKPNVVPGAMSKPPAYNIYTSPDNMTFTLFGSTTSTNFFYNAGTGNHFYFKVAPVSAAGEGSLSSSISCYGQ